MDPSRIRNVAIIAHVDHGKTTLVDQLLYQSGMFRTEELDRLAGGQHNLIFDSDPLERERGITILSKNCAIDYRGTDGELYKINIIDTPGHADFGGEVERVLSMADGVLLLVDAFEGPMPQTRFVVAKALANQLRPIIVINKRDRPNARPEAVMEEVFDLLVELDAGDEVLDFTTIYASGRDGWASLDAHERGTDLRVVFQTIVDEVPPPEVRPDAPLQLLVTSLDYSEYVGRIAIGRISAGTIHAGVPVVVGRPGQDPTSQKVLEVHLFEGLSRRPVEEATAGNICAVVGLDPIHIGDTILTPDSPHPLRPVEVDEPTLQITFLVNNGPFAGREGEYVTSRQLRARLQRELLQNVALRVEDGRTADEFLVAGRGLMHLGILLENMRREGYELSVGMPRVVYREIEGKVQEPIERLVVECPTECQNAVMRLLGGRRAELVRVDTRPGASDYVHLELDIPARALIGIRERMLTATQGRAVLYHTLLGYQPRKGEIQGRPNGVMIATESGAVTSYSLDTLYDRGVFFVEPGEAVYEGQIVGEHNRENDISVNVTRTKKLTNIRAAGKDDATVVRPVRRLSLEGALEYIQSDELVEVTPKAVRLRKRLLREAERRRERRQSAS